MARPCGRQLPHRQMAQWVNTYSVKLVNTARMPIMGAVRTVKRDCRQAVTSPTVRAMHKWAAAGLLAIMAILMIGASRQDSATVDETTHLAAGYSYWLGYRYRMAANHPALSQMLEAAPLLAMDVKMPPIADEILDR